VAGFPDFGIDTQIEQSVRQPVRADRRPNNGDFTTLFNGKSLTQSFFGYRSNGFYFNDTSLTQCNRTNFTTFYCPAVRWV